MFEREFPMREICCVGLSLRDLPGCASEYYYACKEINGVISAVFALGRGCV